jgi:serine protease Do
MSANESGQIQMTIRQGSDPKWSYEKLNLTLQMHYRVFGPDASQLLDGTESHTVGINSSGLLSGFPNAANRVTQLVLLDVLRRLHPNAAKFPSTAHLSALNRDLVIDRTKPVSTGTAFYINKTGQLMTAAHVVRDCLVLEAQKDGKVMPVKLHASSDMLDLAVVDSGQPSDHALPLRIGEETTLGEPVTNVGYPLQGILSSSHNLTRGNVSARGGLKGSQGIFQFSAPVQPGGDLQCQGKRQGRDNPLLRTQFHTRDQHLGQQKRHHARAGEGGARMGRVHRERIRQRRLPGRQAG